MATLSFLDGCHDCIERGHKSWETYFSKWDFLAKNEETLTESGLIEELNENIDQKKQVKLSKNINQKKKKETQRRAKNKKKLLLRLSARKLSLRKRKKTRHRSVKKEPQKKKKTRKVPKPTQQADLVKIDESLMDNSDNQQLEVDLRTVFMNIFKETKTKWEIFGVLSQTISREEMKIKTYWGLELSPKSGNGDDSDRCISIKNQDIVPVNDKMAVSQTGSLDVRLNSFNRPDRAVEILDGNQILNNLRKARGYEYLGGSSNLNQTFPVCASREIGYGAVSPYRPSNPFYLTPKVDFNLIDGFSKGIHNVRNLTHLYLNNSQNESEKRLKPLPLNLSGTSEGGEGSKININKLSFLKARLSDVPEVNVRREKTFQNICLHKRTGDVSLNMGNSNFVTPKRNPSERKCLSENIGQRKKRGRSKLSFFDYVQDDDDDSDSGDPCENRSPVIRWESKKPKIEIEEMKIGDLDSDDLEHIFDRVHKP